MEDITLSKTATRCRREYYRKWRNTNPEKQKIITIRYWEKKAKQLYGEDYIPPRPGETLSLQAKQVKREYYREYQRKNAEAIRKNNADFWERRSKEGETI